MSQKPGMWRAPLLAPALAFAGVIWLLHPASQTRLGADVRVRAACVVTSDVREEAWGRAFTCTFNDGRRLDVTAKDEKIAVGERLVLAGRASPFDDVRNPGEPSARELAAERGVDGRLEHVRVIARTPPEARDVRTWMPRLRAYAARVVRAQLDEPGASILAGALWGERSALPPELRAEFQETGTVHVLVTAGLHLGVIAALAAWLCTRAGCPRLAGCFIAIALVWFYAWFSGAHLPSLRAATMISWGLLARARGVAALSWNNLGAALFVVAGIWPQSVGGASFALSFSCIGAILLFAQPLDRALERAGLTWHPLREALTLTIATQIGVWPLSAATFLIIAPYAVIANAAVVPCIAVVMLTGLVQLALAPIGVLAGGAANLNAWVLEWIVDAVHCIAGLPWAAIVATPPPAWVLATYAVAMVWAAALLRHGRLPAALLLIAFASALVLWPPRAARHDLRVSVLDVGQADGIVIQTPSGHTILVDAGGRLERGPPGSDSPAEAIGERIVVPFLLRQGVHRVDAIVLSHPHGDHAGGIAPVLRKLGADMFADSGQVYGGHAYQDALATARSRAVAIVRPRIGQLWRSDDGVTLHFLWPPDSFIRGTRNDINSNSFVFMLQYRSFRMLFTGDAGSEAEARILASGADLHADVLKVGHHGSAYSSTPEFIHAVDPKYAIISVGRHNLFGHPAAATLQTLHEYGARIYRTDENAAITVSSNGADEDISPSLPSRESQRGATGSLSIPTFRLTLIDGLQRVSQSHDL